MEDNRKNCGRRYLDANRPAIILVYGFVAAMGAVIGFLVGKIF